MPTPHSRHRTNLRTYSTVRREGGSVLSFIIGLGIIFMIIEALVPPLAHIVAALLGILSAAAIVGVIGGILVFPLFWLMDYLDIRHELAISKRACELNGRPFDREKELAWIKRMIADQCAGR